MKSDHSNFGRILVMNLAVLYVAVPQAETMGHIDMLFCGSWEDHKILLLGSWSHEVLVGCILFGR